MGTFGGMGYLFLMNSRQWREVWVISLFTSVMLILCFLSGSQVVGRLLAMQFPKAGIWFVPAHWGFGILTLLFWVTTFGSKKGQSETYELAAPPVNLWLTYFIPVTLALMYGWLFRPGPSLVFGGATAEKLWHLALAPVGEELLFRGWFYSILNQRYDGKMATTTNPFPVAGWFSALAFSLWHLQNWGTYPNGFVVFQLGYTFLAGLWFGLLRWRSGNVLHSILGHAAINFATSLPPFP